jgi:hypothetical protein
VGPLGAGWDPERPGRDQALTTGDADGPANDWIARRTLLISRPSTPTPDPLFERQYRGRARARHVPMIQCWAAADSSTSGRFRRVGGVILTVAVVLNRPRLTISPIRTFTTSQPPSLLSIARSKSARSRRRRSRSEPEPDRPNLLRLESALRTDHASGIRRPALPDRRVELGMSHLVLHLAGLAVGRIRFLP